MKAFFETPIVFIIYNRPDYASRVFQSIRSIRPRELFSRSNVAYREYSFFFDLAYRNQIDSWDYPFQYSIWLCDGLTIIPRTNLISNIGFGKNATHTFNPKDKRNNRPTVPVSFPLRHPSEIAVDPQIEEDIVMEMLREWLKLKARKRSISKAFRRFRRNLSAKLLGKSKPRAYKCAIFVLGLGRCGTTLLYDSLVASKIAKKGFFTKFSDARRRLTPGVYKTHDRAPQFLLDHVKVIFLFRNPFNIAISAHKMINDWGQRHHRNLCSVKFEPNDSVFYKDTMELEKNFDIWFQRHSFSFISIRYETLFEKETLNALNSYLQMKVKLLPRKPCQSQIEDHPQEASIRKTYGVLFEKIQAAEDVKVWEGLG